MSDTPSTPRRGLPRPGDIAAAPTSQEPQRRVRQGLGVAPQATQSVAQSQPAATVAVPDAPLAPAATQSEASAARTRGWIRPVAICVGAVAGAAVVVLLARWLLTLPPVAEFLTQYPGSYELPDSAEPGFPVWLQWQHFLNAFFLVLIVRSGLQVRREQRPNVFWTPRWAKGGSSKVSLTVWFHQSLDALWILNGVVFLVLLFTSGHWMRIVPTSWEVFPNAISAGLQYASLDWPTENGWTNYNSLQQLAYFTTVFIAAPLAMLSGFRMSSLWPQRWERLSRAYRVEWARAVHFPVMLYFVAFVIVHVGLVFATGALRNLNHMYGGTDDENWIGLVLFLVSVLVIAAGWLAARPIILAPLARLTGKVSGR